MTTAANDGTVTIGPATERRIMMAFADTSLLTCAATSKLLGIDEKSLRALVNDGAIRCVRRGGGRTRAYTEGDIRAFLTQGEAPAREQKPKATCHGQIKVVPFSQRKTGNRRG